ncbi:MAG: indolepyruvate ferredoxin oxidoreductase subunit alpha, partial [Symbiobacteriaceae bacterium]|nr:indolepyruvate ferredoxin oxidoreductase subunit alpha [Symbiobacteriaceae bacterium]
MPNIGEISPNIIRLALGIPAKEAAAPEIAPPRPPVLCPGCPHRGVFHILSKLDCLVTGDIGCYTLGALPPLSSLDTCFCMGAALP